MVSSNFNLRGGSDLSIKGGSDLVRPPGPIYQLPGRTGLQVFVCQTRMKKPKGCRWEGEGREEPLSIRKQSREIEKICGGEQQQGLEIEPGGGEGEFWLFKQRWINQAPRGLWSELRQVSSSTLDGVR